MNSKLFTLALLLCGGVALAQQPYTLEQLTDSARANNLAMHNGQLDISAAAEQRREAFTNYFPTIQANGGWVNMNRALIRAEGSLANILPAEMAQMLPAEAAAALASPIGINLIKNGTLAGVTAIQPLYAGGQITAGNRLAEVGEQVAALQLQLSANEVEKTTHTYFWQLASLNEKLRTVEAAERLLSDIRKDVEVAIRAGVALRNDLLQISLRQNEVQSQRLQIENGQQIVRLLLAHHCGLASDGFTICPDTAYSHPTEATLYRPDEALNRLPEYQLLQKNVEAAALARRMEAGRRLPQVGVGAGYNYSDLMGHGQMRASVFATVSVPISHWWGGTHAVKRRQIEQQKAEASLADNSALLKIQMQNAWNNLQEARLQLDIAQQSIDQAAENLRLHRNLYRAGTATMSDLLEAQLLHQQSIDRRTEAWAAYQLRLLDYRQAIGE